MWENLEVNAGHSKNDFYVHWVDTEGNFFSIENYISILPLLSKIMISCSCKQEKKNFGSISNKKMSVTNHESPE